MIVNISYRSEPCFSMGLETLKVPMSLYALNRERLVAKLRARDDVPSEGAVVLLEGGKQETRHCSDHEPVFRQVKCYTSRVRVVCGSMLE